jgi:alanyl-tRNA synthetase
MTSEEIRQAFLDFFKSKGHRIVDSAPVVPYGDPTLLFINAGMNQFKDVFLGTGTRDYKRAVDTQKCIRVSGKHNDLEEVGVDTYHHTLFEMLGNWSFGDYYKIEAIDWAWELLTKIWKLDASRLYATVYRTDDEAFEIWRKYLPENHIQRFDEKDNFWEMGATGPCGPCSEIHYDRTSDLSGASLVNAGSPDVIEIWNLVFIQFNRKADGTLEPLANKFVDTGMGFERICSILQGVKSNYDTDVFSPLLNKISGLSGIEYGASEKTDIAMRVITDHIRTLSFAIADGTLPGNEGRSYVLRRILRRGLRYARSLGLKEPVMYKLVQTLVDTMGSYFKELPANQTQIEKIIKGEEESFLQTMERGIEKIDAIIADLKENKKDTIKGEDAFLLYDTYGFPLDLTELLARENGLKVDITGFGSKMKEQKERSRSARKQTSSEILLPIIDSVTKFVGYVKNSKSSKVLYAKDNVVVTAETPFYAEMGGQVSDIGKISLPRIRIRYVNYESETLNPHVNISFNVIDVKKIGNTFYHILDVDENEDISKYFKVNVKVNLRINIKYRRSIMRNHTATHLLHEALRRTFGEHLHQSGSLVTAEHLRFDFNHSEKISKEQLKELESIVNRAILSSYPIKTEIMNIEEAKKNPKIKMFFGDKYGDEVRVVSIPNFSIELCGGTHCINTSQIGFFKITSESSIAAGVRRIEAITGQAAFDYVNNLEDTIENKNKVIDELKLKIKQIEKDVEKQKLFTITTNIFTDDAKEIDGIRVSIKKMELEKLEQLRTIAEKIREQFGTNGICLIASIIEEKVQLACAVTDDLKSKYPAGKLVGDAAKQVGGGGGGKPHLATAGGRDITKLDELLNTKFYEIIKNYIN